MEFKLPDIGEGVHEGEIVKWLVKEGDSVKVDQPMVEIMTDKATVEIPTSTAGVIQKLNAKEGDVVKVGQVIAVLGSSGSEVAQTQAPAAKPAASAPKPAAPAAKPGASVPKPAVAAAMTPAPAPQRSSVSPTTSSYTATPGNVLATPATRRLARDLGVDLSRVDPTGPHGRVTKEDVQRFGGASAAGPAMPVSNHGTSLARSSASLPARGRAGGGELETLVPFRGIRRKISEAMSRSRTLIPEFTYVDEVNVSELVAFRKEVKEIAEKQGVKLTYLPFICKALIRAFREFPTLNASLDEQGGNVIVKNYFNIGIAVDTEDGLIVPNIKNADQKSILQLAAEITELAEKARTRRLSLEEMQGGTFTITNPGPIGGLITAPVINWPEVAILAVHKIVKRPIVTEDDEIKAASMMYLSLAVDHRVVDGAVAARFMNVVIEYLASPKLMMLDMA